VCYPGAEGAARDLQVNRELCDGLRLYLG